MQLSAVSQNFQNLTRLVCAWTAKELPDFPFSSLQINYNYAAKKHVDGNNIGPSHIISLGDHAGGELWVADCVEIKFTARSYRIAASTSTPSTRRLLDGVAVSVPHRSTEPARPRHCREMN